MKKKDNVEKKQIKEEASENTEKEPVEGEKNTRKKSKHHITKTEIINKIIATCIVIVMVFAVVATIIFYLKYYVQ